MATITLYGVSVQDKKDTGKVEHYPEAAGQSFKKGEFVYLVSGKVTACGSDATLIAGVSLQDASGVADTLIAIEIAEPGTTFEVNVTTTTSVAIVGGQYGLYVASNKHQVDLGDTTNKRFVIRALSKKDAVGDTYGRVIVEVLGVNCQLSGIAG